ncbi:MAG TPA: hypothetical protein VKG38_00185 [Solirubrobacteraceae bacterium]|nr:hypothetical protein [Solirubrobacteraceae bacterium]
MTTRPQPDDYDTLGRYVWARPPWLSSPGGSLIGTLAPTIGFGLLTGSALVLVVDGLLGTVYARSRP